MTFEDIDDDMPMDKPADYYKDEYGICPHCKHKLSEEEMERKMCSNCLQKLSGKTKDLTCTGSDICNFIVGIIAILIMSLFVIWIACLCLVKFDISKSFILIGLLFKLCYELIKVILGIIIIVAVILFVLKIFDLDYRAHVKQRARYNNDILHEMGKDREVRKSRGRWYD